MKKLFDEVNSLDKRCYEKFALSEDVLMEHAAFSMYDYIAKKFKKNTSILIVCGSGNNGADGIALARLLHSKYDVSLYISSKVKSPMAKLQYERVKALGVKIVDILFRTDVVVDCLFGTGLNKPLRKKDEQIIQVLNSFNSFKIACDIPSGINTLGQIESTAFKSDITITMGALKTSLFSDIAKDFVGKIKVANLGLQRKLYETSSNKYLLEKSDMILPFRNKQNTHKGTFGHLNVFIGDKQGAGIIAAKAAFSFGCGLVSVVSSKDFVLPYDIMQTNEISENCTAIAIGMGLGKYDKKEIKKILKTDIPKVIDADLFYDEIIKEAFESEVVLTPHPKEFISLLKICSIADINIEQLQKNRIFYVQEFCKKYSNVVLLLKGANVIIAKDSDIYINPFGSVVLSKGGSGDVLCGLISALLAQGYSPLNSAISGSLAHTLAAKKYKKNNYSLSPLDIIKGIKKL